MRRPTLAVFLATVVVAVGVVVVVASSRGGTAAPRSSSSVGTTASIVMTAPSALVTAPPSTTRTLTVDSGCRLGGGPLRLDPVPAQVSARVNRAWERIETWLAEHAPVTAASLHPPAHDRLIMVTQREVGVRLPPELIASLRRHDGVSGGDPRTEFSFPPFMRPLSTENIVGEARVMCDVLESLGDDGAVEAWWHGRFVPVATNYGGDLLFLDGARLGRHYEAGDVAFDGGYAELLEETADALSGGGEYRPVVVDGVLSWEF